MSDNNKTIYRQIATDLKCSYTHVKQVLAPNSELNKNTALNKRIVMLYVEKTKEELDMLIASIKEEATNQNTPNL